MNDDLLEGLKFPKAPLNHSGGAETKVEGTREVAAATGCHIESIRY